jgi:hypothetical protein
VDGHARPGAQPVSGQPDSVRSGERAALTTKTPAMKPVRDPRATLRFLRHGWCVACNGRAPHVARLTGWWRAYPQIVQSRWRSVLSRINPISTNGRTFITYRFEDKELCIPQPSSNVVAASCSVIRVVPGQLS